MPKRKIAMPPKKPGSSKKYSVAPLMPEGEILTDFHKKQWRLEKSFATGGFGRLYYAKPVESTHFTGNYVIKMEPAENGPLFQEFHVYCRIMKPEMVEKYKKLKSLEFLGVPSYYGAGLHEKNGLTHRFLILPRLGSDLGKIFADGKLSNETDVFRLFSTCLNIYEYLHNNFYVHADLKAENLLLADCRASKSPKIWQSYLMDYGLAKKLPERPVYREQPKKAHDGTLIFTSLDAHRGCDPSYRGDLEILGYNLVLWLSGSLPWQSFTQPERVFEAKIKFRDNLHKELTCLFGVRCSYVKPLQEFFQYAYELKYEDKPNYVRVQSFAEDCLKKLTTKSKNQTNSDQTDEAKTSANNVTVRNKSPVKKPAAKNQIHNSQVVVKSPKLARKLRSVVKVVPETESESDADMFDSTSTRSKSKPSPRPKYVPQPSETADSSTDDDYCAPLQAAASASLRQPVFVAENETADSSTESDLDKPSVRPPIRRKPLSQQLETKATSKPANRRLSTLEAAIVKKYCRVAPKTRKPIKKPQEIVEENGCYGIESITDINDVGTQTSPGMWENRRRQKRAT